MRLIIISGRSGSGKSTALHVLEDSGFTCIDNLPTSLLPSLLEKISKEGDKEYAVSIDARNSEQDIESLPELVESPAIEALDYQIIFLDAEDDILLKRFSETRRRHPLSDKETDLRSAIIKEKERLKPIINVATIIIDTSDMGFHDLRDLVKRHMSALESASISLVFQSFGFKHGIPRDADLVFDVRCLPNPHWEPNLRAMTGNDNGVIQFLEKETEVDEMYQDIYQFLEKWLPRFEASNRSYITIAIGCTGGQHRSVFLANKLAKNFNPTFSDVQCRHRDIRQ
ncbi:MAG: RNase adapter RapZ [Cellvibrionaceae bacterium]